jgi:phosphoribosylanthranilate isomerase
MLTQIYEIATEDEAREISGIGVDHIGVLVGDGEFPREQPFAAAARIAAAMSPPARFTALFLTSRLDLIEAGLRELRPHILHLGAAPELLLPEDVAALKSRWPDIPIMRSIPVCAADGIALVKGVDTTALIKGVDSVTLALAYDGIADWLLLDSHRPADRQIGALGITHDWTISRRIVETVQVPVILAGGLGPDNVAEAIRAVRPAGVDSQTKTDRDGSHAKDPDRVRRFHLAAKAHD